MHTARNKSVNEKLFYRELQGKRGISSIPNLYGSRKWVNELDIVGELRGHDGCINALQWSRDGSLLASGSDDTRVNIYKANAGFSLNTQIETGHTQNIFSLKFMPHSSDRTIITAAGDTQVRVFDIEYAPTTYVSLSDPLEQPETPPLNPRRRRGFRGHQQPVPGKIHTGAKRAYTSHTDRVKRLVTESSPHLFLTCSEDGTVRQFDLRQPSEFYTRPGAGSHSRPAPFGIVGAPAYPPDDEDERNPPLISYRRHEIELNTISCSTSQPHYIAVGGSHLYCFLHDRRMLGRDRMKEAGRMYSRIPLREEDEGSMAGATKCVRRFAPRMGQNWDRRIQNSHVTSCKISDAYPDELLVSWSGDGIYLFNMKYSPQPNEEDLGREPFDLEQTRSRRRAKREHVAAQRARKRRRSKSPTAEDAVPGQSTRRICSLVVELRSELFGYNSSNLLADTGNAEAERKKSYDAALALAHSAFCRIKSSIENLDQRDISTLEMLGVSGRRSSLQAERTRRSTLAKNRRRARAFVIAAGCVARALGGWVEGIGLESGLFELISLGLNETTTFRYRFLNAVLAFINAGMQGVKAEAEAFAKEEAELLEDSEDERSPPPPPSSEENIRRYLDDLERGAQPTPVRNVDTNEEIFDSELAMVQAFRLVVQGSDERATLGNAPKRFWGEKVARAVLMKEGEGIDFDFAEKAFEGDDEVESPEVQGVVSRLIARESTGISGDGDTEMDDGDESGDSENEDESDEDEDEDEEDDDGDLEGDETDDDDEGESWYQRRRHRRAPVEAHAPVWEHTKVYRGHCNVRTVKDVNFFGLNDEYVVSGSDCGHLFIWDKKTTKLVQLLFGDDETVNVAVGHPYEPTIAVSGIDYTVKLFSPDSQAQQEFGERAGPENMIADGDNEYSGRASRRRLHNSQPIMNQNAVTSETGINNAVITVSLSGIAISFAEWDAMYHN
ncbi:wd and tetratricopeptide repeat protein [Sphaerosporella brunnea]|uniref:Wd and tetratricopeptide repeat protein n=1 Tax=Sphaerosporella brunnea TaxID=1250544 RepID=A0A5J5EEL9_9PEZI|nr:wd and tetratricopeptide repeat protein [Sphaerosporella brunnea]